MEFRDRRPNGHLPRPEDYETPLSKTSLAEANRRFRASGVSAVIRTDPYSADTIIRRATKARFNSRREAEFDFRTIGEYLEYLNGATQ